MSNNLRQAFDDEAHPEVPREQYNRNARILIAAALAGPVLCALNLIHSDVAKEVGDTGTVLSLAVVAVTGVRAVMTEIRIRRGQAVDALVADEFAGVTKSLMDDIGLVDPKEGSGTPPTEG